MIVSLFDFVDLLQDVLFCHALHFVSVLLFFSPV